jgi:hypothetical protein
LLVVLLEGVSRAELERAVAASADEVESVFIVAPIHVSALDWLATDEARARGAAAARVLEAEWLLEGVAELGGEAGEADPVLAVGDALGRFPADEIVLVGHGAVDGALVSSLRGFGLPLRLSGVSPAAAGIGSRARGLLSALRSGRSAGTPFAAFVVANLGLLLLALVASLLVGLVVWLVGAL